MPQSKSLRLAALAAGTEGWNGAVCLSPLIHGVLGSLPGRSSHRPASPCPAGEGSAGIRLYSQAKHCDAHHTEPPEGGTDTGGEQKPKSSAEVWQAGSEGDQKVTHPSHTFFFEIWRGGRGENRHPAVPAPPPGFRLQPARPAGTADGWARGTPGPAAAGGGRAPAKEGRGRAGAAAEGRGLPAPPLCCTAEAPSSRASGLRGGSAGPDHRPPGTALPRGHCASRGELRPPPRTPAPPRPQPGPPPRGHTGSAARRRFPPGGTPLQPGCWPLAPAPSGDAAGPAACGVPARGGSSPSSSRAPGGANPRQSRRPCRTSAAVPADPCPLRAGVKGAAPAPAAEPAQGAGHAQRGRTSTGPGSSQPARPPTPLPPPARRSYCSAKGERRQPGMEHP